MEKPPPLPPCLSDLVGVTKTFEELPLAAQLILSGHSFEEVRQRMEIDETLLHEIFTFVKGNPPK
jgi:hypothetical protein